jgi:hypothetical protein
VQKVDTGKIYAMKLLKKDDMLKKDQARWSFSFLSLCRNADGRRS